MSAAGEMDMTSEWPNLGNDSIPQNLKPPCLVGIIWDVLAASTDKDDQVPWLDHTTHGIWCAVDRHIFCASFHQQKDAQFGHVPPILFHSLATSRNSQTLRLFIWKQVPLRKIICGKVSQ